MKNELKIGVNATGAEWLFYYIQKCKISDQKMSFDEVLHIIQLAITEEQNVLGLKPLEFRDFKSIALLFNKFVGGIDAYAESQGRGHFSIEEMFDVFYKDYYMQHPIYRDTANL